ncbi:TIGR04222 domain-containing membrane protein [Saccharothrix algeriensis]|uniref:Uncharacterized protein (TIGR04222 family) n=1 Tax=Saccharothrix algeriensis TaxID=173560 RepID=A0ABS2S3W5_9PSEU|nr:TIGR04222 domain-containing membrane protein [Saccharothrix algeriensis]MBM7810604.1 uncharacterized protein (TIGR04222 family) [Saccharothrix algeriensis]
MERPWGLSGPEFLELYWIALAASLVVAIVVRVRLRGARGGDPAGVLDRCELAFLTGGPRRAVETSVASLIDAGALRSSRHGAVRVVGAPVAHDPVDRAVLADATRYRNRTLTLLITAVAEHHAVRAVGDRLVERGYLVPPRTARRRLLGGVAPMALVAAAGLARWVNGLAIGAPVGLLTLQLVLTGVLIALLRKANPLTRTSRGVDAIARARSAASAGPVGAAGVVALDGFRAHPDVPLRAAASGPRTGRRGTGSDGGSSFFAAGAVGSSCGSGSGGCGSGSSCGGGGGGCGGGGGS